MSKLGSLAFYIIIYSISAGLVYFSFRQSKKGTKRILMFIAIMIPTVVAGLRWNVGTDFQNYQLTYRTYSQMGLIPFVTNREFLYGWGVWGLAQISKLLGGERVFFALFAFIIYALSILSFKQYRNANYFLCSFTFLLGTFTTGLNIMKQTLAVSIIFWGLMFVYKKELWKYVLTVLVAASFHTTAIVGILIYWLYDSEQNGRIWNIRNVMAVIIGIFIASNAIRFIPVLGNISFMNISRYSIEYGSGHEGSNLTFYILLMQFIIILYFQLYLIRSDDKNKLLIVMVGVGTGLTLTGFFSAYVKRIADYYSGISTRFLIAALPSSSFTRNSRLLADILVATFYVLLFTISYYFKGFSDIIPFQFS